MKHSIANNIMFKKRLTFLAPHGALIVLLPQIRPVTSKSQRVEVMTSCFKKLVQALNLETSTCEHLKYTMGGPIFTVSICIQQEMSQSRDECPQRNWSSIRQI